ncbi:PAS domain S-box-containing protein [Salinibacter ruber]|uniref:sensor histidine kinase n=1 Tax=Salinibacter ruber TaxID=146919 RepID=UPI00216765BA|nr:PAS domain-containing protein [Salinibacter ruber]MCS3658281.1 PAS domain S-box-containing protein [Salinibacter ruber]
MSWLFRCIGSFLAMFSTWFTTGPPSLSKGKALWVLVGLGGGLAAALLADVYVDWARQEDLLWSTLLENAVPLGLALSLPYLGWRSHQNAQLEGSRQENPQPDSSQEESLQAERSQGKLSQKRFSQVAFFPAGDVLREAARWSLIGAFWAFTVGGLATALQLLQQEAEPSALVLHVSTVGAVGGLLVGWAVSQIRRFERRQKKETERKLQKSRERLQMAVEGGNIGTWDWDLETGEVIFNRQWAEMLGYSREELDFHFSTWEELVHPVDLERALSMLDRYIEGEVGTYDPEIRMRTKSGDWKWVQTIGKVISRDGTGKATRAAGIHLDIDERKRSKEALKKDRDLLSRLLETSPDAIVRLDAEGTFAWVGGRAEEVLQASEEEILGRTYDDPAWNLSKPDGSPILKENLPFAQVMSSDEPVRDIEISIEGEGGERRHLSVSGAPLAGEVSQENQHAGDRPKRERMSVADGSMEDALEEGGAVFYLTDITNRKRRKKRLREQNERLERQNDLFERAQEIASVGAWEYDVQSDEMIMTDEAYRIGGLETGAEMTRERGISFYHPEDQPVIRRAIAQAIEKGEPYDLELRLVMADGENRWVRTRGEPQRMAENSEDENDRTKNYEAEHSEGEVARLRGTIQDITARKERERKLQKLKSRYQTLADNFPDGAVYLFDRDLTHRLAGGQELSKVGLSAEEVVGKTLHDLFPDEIADRQVQFYRQALDGEKSVFEETYQGQHYRVQTLPVRDEGGEVTAGMAVARNITDRWRQRKELRQRKEKVRALYETADRLLQASSREEVGDALIEVTQETLGHEGVSVRLIEGGELVATHVAESTLEFMPERPDFRVDGESAVAEIYRAGETLVVEDLEDEDLDLSHDYGDLRSVVAVPLGKHGLFAVTSPEPEAIGEFDAHLIEVLARYAALVLGRLEREENMLRAKEAADRARQEAERSRRKAEEAARLKTSMLANMSHEVRTPLTSILGFAEAIEEETQGLDPPVKTGELELLGEFAGLIQRSGQRLMETLTSVLNLSRLESGEMNLDSTPIDLAAEAKKTAEEFRPQAEEKGLRLQAQLPSRPVWAKADKGGVQIVLQNLLSNAIKYTEKGGMWLRVCKEEREVVIEVEDSGIGMEPDVAEGLFEPFRQESEGVSREYEGTGLGLAVTREAVEQMGGSVEVETEKGEGSCFTARLPQAREKA